MLTPAVHDFEIRARQLAVSARLGEVLVAALNSGDELCLRVRTSDDELEPAEQVITVQLRRRAALVAAAEADEVTGALELLVEKLATRTCTRCGTERPLSQFAVHSAGSRRGVCRPCEAARVNSYYRGRRAARGLLPRVEPAGARP
jgi:hypothetical protein